VLFYLNTVDDGDGGETAFPIADELEMDFEVGGITSETHGFVFVGV
jgi:hypothetical protein